jgi:hypothetical protein
MNDKVVGKMKQELVDTVKQEENIFPAPLQEIATKNVFQ